MGQRREKRSLEPLEQNGSGSHTFSTPSYEEIVGINPLGDFVENPGPRGPDAEAAGS
jgi:hypothetical protein